MNIQEYITPEMAFATVGVGVLLLIYFVHRVVSNLHQRNSSNNELEGWIDNMQDYNEELPRVTRPNAGQLWYRRTDDYQPFINTDIEPVKILEYRHSDSGHWVKYELSGNTSIELFDNFRIKYMADEFDDIKPAVVKAPKKEEQELELLVEFEETEHQVPNKNVVTLNGQDYVLAPIS